MSRRITALTATVNTCRRKASTIPANRRITKITSTALWICPAPAPTQTAVMPAINAAIPRSASFPPVPDPRITASPSSLVRI